MEDDREKAIRDTNDWIAGQALGDIDIEPLFVGVCERFVAAGIAVRRAHLAVPTLHPMVGAVSVRWLCGAASEQTSYRRQAGSHPEWEQSPLKQLEVRDLRELRIPLDDDDGEWRDFPLLVELREMRFTDYLCFLTTFGSDSKGWNRRDGMLTSWATDRPGGFTEDDVAALRRVLARLGVGVKMANREATALNVLTAYLGAKAGRRVLDGQIQRGDGDSLHAVIWYSDLRGSTPLAEGLSGPDFLALLNGYFECTAGAVLDHGGEVLRYIGDAVLAIFQVDGPGGDARAARMAMAAAQDARAHLARLNRSRGERGENPIDFGLALHVGEVMFGNVGVPERIDFTVIGPAVNEVARLEGLTKTLGRRIIVSNAFSRLLPLDWEALGENTLRGVGSGRRVYAPPAAG
ncbi:MAG: adenylate/guanylate cyclase domain-containing protein [Pseudomonadota bacterium]